MQTKDRFDAGAPRRSFPVPAEGWTSAEGGRVIPAGPSAAKAYFAVSERKHPSDVETESARQYSPIPQQRAEPSGDPCFRRVRAGCFASPQLPQPNPLQPNRPPSARAWSSKARSPAPSRCTSTARSKARSTCRATASPLAATARWRQTSLPAKSWCWARCAATSTPATASTSAAKAR